MRKKISFVLACIMAFSSVNVSWAETPLTFNGEPNHDDVVESSSSIQYGMTLKYDNNEDSYENTDSYDISDDNSEIIVMSHNDTDIVYPVEGGNIYFRESYGEIVDCDKSVTNVVIPNEINNVKVRSIGLYVFDDCNDLISVTIPDSITSIGDTEFTRCNNLVAINVDENNTAYTSIDGVLYSKSLFFLECYPSGKTQKEFTIPNVVRSIGNCAFENSTNLTTIVIPDNIIGIGMYAFRNCNNLSDIKIPSQVSSIGRAAFSDCSSLTNISIPERVTNIEYATFSGCSSLSSVTIPNSITNIEYAAFSGCNSLSSIIIPDSVTNMGGTESSVGYNMSGAKGSVFSGCSSLTSMTIPDSVINIETDNLFRGCSSLVNVTIPNSITIIGNSTFDGCSSLTSVTIPNGVTSIGNLAFSNCSNLINITIPDSVTNIGGYAFENCSNLINVIIPDSVTSIDSGVFENCSSLTSITIPEKVETFNTWRLFEGCSNLISVNLPKCVTSIDKYAFKGCSSLISISIPDGVTSIGEYAFEDCSSLKNITIPDSVASIKNRAFYRCDNIETLNISQVGLNYGWANMKNLRTVNFIGKITVIKSSTFAGCINLIDIKIPDTVDNIESCAFQGCSSLTNIKIPNSVVNIGNSAFGGCVGITSIIIPHSLTNISYGTFSGCTGLKNVTIPNSITSIGGSAFSNCSSLTNITIPNSVTNIGSSAFSNCSNLTSIKIPNSITKIEGGTFRDCTALSNIIIPDSVTDIQYGGVYDGGAFSGCSNLKSLTIPDSITNIGFSTFNGCDNIETLNISQAGLNYGWANHKNLKTVNFIGNITEIKDSAFSGCSNLKNLSIPDSVTSIGSKAFSGCSSLTSVIIPNGVTRINYDTFKDCSELKNIIIPDSVTGIGISAFEGCNNLTNITIPDSVMNIGSSAFECCNSLTSILIPNSITKISSSAFKDCSSLINITIPDNVAYIESDAFDGCCNVETLNLSQNGLNYGWQNSKKLMDVNFIGQVTYIKDATFSGCTNLANITIPDSVSSIGKDSFAECNKLTIYCSSGSYAEQYAKKNSISCITDAYIYDETNLPDDIGDICFESKTYDLTKSYFLIEPQNGIYELELNVKLKDENMINQVEFTCEDGSVLELEPIKHTGFVISLLNGDGYNYRARVKTTLLKNGETIVTAKLPNGDTAYCLVRVKCYETGYSYVEDTEKPHIKLNIDYDDNLSYYNNQFSKSEIPVKVNVSNYMVIGHEYTEEELNNCKLSSPTIKISLPAGLTFSSDINDKERNFNLNDIPVNGGESIEFSVYPTKLSSKQLIFDVVFNANDNYMTSKGTINVDTDKKFNYDVATPTFLGYVWNDGTVSNITNEESVKHSISNYKQAVAQYEEYIRGRLTNMADVTKNEDDAIFSKMRSYIESEYEISFYPGWNDKQKECVVRAIYDYISQQTQTQIGLGNIDISKTDDQGVIKFDYNVAKTISKNMEATTLTYDYDNYEVQLSVVGFIAKFGSVTIKDKKIGLTDGQGGFVNKPEKVQSIMQNYLYELKAMDVNAVDSAIYQTIDFLSDNLGINKYIKSKCEKLITNYLPELQNKDLAEVVTAINDTRNVYSKLKKIDTNDLYSSKSTIESIMNMGNALDNPPRISSTKAKEMYNVLRTARNDMISAFTAYLTNSPAPEGYTVQAAKKIYGFECPVNITVYDENNTILGSVTDDETVCNSSDIEITKKGDLKAVILYKDLNVHFVIDAYDYGSLNVVVENYNDEGVAQERKLFYNIPIDNNQVLSIDTANDEVIKTDSNNYKVNEIISANESGYINVNVECENGKVYGLSQYVKGDNVSLTAEPDDEYIFLGWYLNDEFLTNSIVYEFTAKEDINLIAKFAEIQDLSFDDDEDITEPINEQKFLIADVDCDNNITASDAAFVLQKTLISTFELPIEKKTDDWLKYVDVDDDTYVTASDAAFILQKTLISTFELPAEKK